MPRTCILLLGLSLVTCPSYLRGFQSPFTRRVRRCVSCHETTKKEDEAEQDNDGRRGWLSNYKFGDLTKSLAKRATSSINELTGKDEYEFGDLTRFLDQRAKSSVNELTGKDQYEFGDLSRFADARIKERLNNFTGNEQYEFGDITKEILRRVATGEYKLQDMFLLCKVLVSFGVGLAPVASALPAKLMLDMLNYSLAQEVGGRLLEALAVSLDQRFKETLTGNADYQLGDLTKRAVLDFIGKDDAGSYEFGDISRSIAKRLDSKDKQTRTFGAVSSQTERKSDVETMLDPRLVAELEKWDLERSKIPEKKD